MSNWSELLHDLLVRIAERIEKLEDFITFGAVCKGWSKARKKKHFKGLWLRQETPYLMLPVINENVDICQFYSLIEDEIVASVKIPKLNGRKCYESLGWLLVIDIDGNMCLLDSFSSVEIPVPHPQTFPLYHGNDMDHECAFIQKMVLSARPSETSYFIVMTICGALGHLGFWRPGDDSWTLVTTQQEVYTDVMYHDGHFFAIGNIGGVWAFSFEGHNQPKGRMVTSLVANNLYFDKKLYILKTSQSLFVISRDAFEYNDEDNRLYDETKRFKVYEVHMYKGTWTMINNIGSMAIFVGYNATFAVDSSRYSGKIKGNHIYFTEDGWETYLFDEKEGGGKDIGAYNMETRTIESFNIEEVLVSKVFPSIWITPSF